ncbi:protein CIP2A homolog [Haliotis cracherodii]|uniref:protein CIP2A homolog n=1 Tax=Haliotis cracherodii TaxID=6455 RepID=UPI0039ED46DD
MEAAPCVKQVTIAANQYHNSRSNSNLIYLQRQLEILHGVIGRTLPLKFFNPRQLLAAECLTCIVDILNDSQSKSGLVLKCLTVLNQIGQEHDMKEMLHTTFNLTPVLAGVLKLHGGPSSDQLTAECLQLMMKITHGHRISFHESFMEDLLKYLIKQVLTPNEITQSCLGLLANLSRDNYTVQSYVKSLENFKRLMRMLCTYISDKNLTVAVFSMCVLTSLCLHEEIGQEIFNTENVNETLKLIFNILVNGDFGVTRLYVVDLFQDLLKKPSIQNSLQRYKHLQICINHTLNLIASSTGETVTKLFELLLSFCTLGTIRTSICKTLFSAPRLQSADHYRNALKGPVSGQSEPLFAVVHWAMQTVDTSDTASLFALDLLTEIYEEVLYSGRTPDLCIHSDLLLPVLVEILRSSVDGDATLVRRKCNKVVKAVRLLTVLCSEDDLKASLVDLVDTPLFQTIIAFQLDHNKILHPKPGPPQPDDWSEAGIEVALVCMHLMTKIKRYVRDMDVYISGLLQDGRIVPFLASGLVCEKSDTVQLALRLVCQGSTLENFPDVILGDAVAALNVKKAEETSKSSASSVTVTPMKHSNQQVKRGLDNKENVPVKSMKRSVSDNENIDTSLQSLIEKMHTSLEVKDTKASDIIEIYEHRFQTLQTKEEHLENLLEAKTMAVAQADRLIAQYRARQARYEGETQKMRCYFQESERKAEKYQEQINTLNLERETLQHEFDQQAQDLQRLELKSEECEELKAALTELQEKHDKSERSLLCLQQEHKTMSEMHDMLQKHHESLKQQHDVTTDHLRKLEDERKQISKLLKEKETKLQETTKTLQKTDEKLKKVSAEKSTIEEEKDKMELTVDQLRTDIQRAEQLRRDLQHKMDSLEAVVQDQENAMKEREDKLAVQQAEIDKHQQIAALIHSLSGGKDGNPPK